MRVFVTPLSAVTSVWRTDVSGAGISLLQAEFRDILVRTMVTPALVPAIASRKGKDLFVPRSASLPAQCVKCGAPASTPWRKKFYWHTPWLALLILINLLIYIIVAVIVRKNMELNVPLCDTHHTDRKRYKLLAILMIAGCIPLGLVLGTFLSEPLGWITGLLMFFASVIFYFLGGLGFRPVKIDENGGVFRGACASFLDLLPEQQVQF